ncbi:glycosyltransferase family 4 protein [Edaphobacter flagellatus]|uniref:glycosyltransferase family 4 protein n=1 Tax=Edaphobacter flagellatus TaxID=1933044 RepID=UPI0021B4C21A|nr:glycosyltransferase family 1 protein [Edaphobacter flagellatus]
MNTDRYYRVGFVLHSNLWVGGQNYLKNLFAAIHALPYSVIKPVVFTGTKADIKFAEFPRVEVIRTRILDHKGSAWFLREGIGKVTKYDFWLRRLLRRHHVSALSHLFSLRSRLPVPTIGWIPDLQHVYLPEFFSVEERKRRDREFMELCVNCDKVIVSSECAGIDLQSFAPEYTYKTELLRFVGSPVLPQQSIHLQELQKIYGFEGPYFLLPNQFWAHKNHRVVISALNLLKSKNKRVLVLATGSTQDYRHPTFFSSLMQYAGECGVLDAFRVLGQIPYDHLVALMQHAIALINPSRFEGWSSTVEEAKSIGKQIVLSDIPVHREQAPQRCFFFPPDDPDALADQILAALNQFDQRHEALMQEAASAQFSARQKAYGERYEQIVLDVLKNLNSNSSMS